MVNIHHRWRGSGYIYIYIYIEFRVACWPHPHTIHCDGVEDHPPGADDVDEDYDDFDDDNHGVNAEDRDDADDDGDDVVAAQEDDGDEDDDEVEDDDEDDQSQTMYRIPVRRKNVSVGESPEDELKKRWKWRWRFIESPNLLIVIRPLCDASLKLTAVSDITVPRNRRCEPYPSCLFWDLHSHDSWGRDLDLCWQGQRGYDTGSCPQMKVREVAIVLMIVMMVMISDACEQSSDD